MLAGATGTMKSATSTVAGTSWVAVIETGAVPGWTAGLVMLTVPTCCTTLPTPPIVGAGMKTTRDEPPGNGVTVRPGYVDASRFTVSSGPAPVTFRMLPPFSAPAATVTVLPLALLVPVVRPVAFDPGRLGRLITLNTLLPDPPEIVSDDSGNGVDGELEMTVAGTRPAMDVELIVARTPFGSPASLTVRLIGPPLSVTVLPAICCTPVEPVLPSVTACPLWALIVSEAALPPGVLVTATLSRALLSLTTVASPGPT